MKQLTMREVMTGTPHSVGTDQSLQVAKKLMTEHGVRHLPVRESGKLVGVISDRDIHYAMAIEKKDAASLHIGDAYTLEPYVVGPDKNVAEVARHMAHNRFGCALVVDGAELLGIFTTTDALAVLAEVLSGKQEQ